MGAAPANQDVFSDGFTVWGQIGDNIGNANATRVQFKSNVVFSISLTWKELTTQKPC